MSLLVNLKLVMRLCKKKIAIFVGVAAVGEIRFLS
jgi:hypothetical protein